MASRRQEKVARIIKESVGDTILKRLDDPRIQGLVSVTGVDVSPDLKNADVYLSIMSPNEKAAGLTFEAIRHAGRFIQSRVGDKITARHCPHLQFHEDKNLKKTLETLRLIDQASEEFENPDQEGDDSAEPNGRHPEE